MMPKRRMISPEIWFNEKFASLPDPGRLLFIGIFSNADDDGRLKASPKYLKAHIFPYDENKTLDEITEMRDRLAEDGLIRVYSRNGTEYLDLPGWKEHQLIRQDRYKPSELPSFNGKDNELTTNGEPMTYQPTTNGEPSLSQSKSVKSNISKFNIVECDFSQFLENEVELTDRLTTVLTENMSAGRARAGANLSPESEAGLKANWGVPTLKSFWEQAVGKMSTELFDGARKALREYPVGIIAKAFGIVPLGTGKGVKRKNDL